MAKTCDWHLRWGQSVALSLYPVVSVLTLHSVRIELNYRYLVDIWRIGWGGKKHPYICENR